MKKKIALVVLAAVLLAGVAGTAFAQVSTDNWTYIPFTFDRGNIPAQYDVRITKCYYDPESVRVIFIAFSSPGAMGRINFEFKAYYRGAPNLGATRNLLSQPETTAHGILKR